MPNLVFVIGVAATGKSYFIKQRYEEKNVDILDVYDYQQRAYDEAGFGEMIPVEKQFRCLMSANTKLLDDIVERLKKGRDVVVEQTFFKAKRRIAYIDEIRKIPNVRIEMYVMCPGEEQWKKNLKKRDLGRNFEYYKALKKEMEFPNVAEGIDEIYEVVDSEIRLRVELPRYEILEPAREELAKEGEKIRLEDEERLKRENLLAGMKEYVVSENE